MKGGHLRPEVYFNMPTYIEKYGYEAAAEISKFEVSHLQAIRDLVEKEQIDCDLTLTRTYDVFLDEEYAKTSRQAYDKMIRSGITSIKDAHYTPAKQAELVCDPLNLQRSEVKSSDRGLTHSGLWCQRRPRLLQLHGGPYLALQIHHVSTRFRCRQRSQSSDHDSSHSYIHYC